MKFVLIAASLMIAPSVSAQTAAPAAAPGAAAALSLDTPIETIAANPAGKAVLEANMPGITTHAQYAMFKGMTLKQVAPMSGGQITEAVLAKTQADLAGIK